MMMMIMTNFKGYLSRQLDCGVIQPNNDYLIKHATKNIFLFTRVLASKHTYGMHPEIALVGKKRDYERAKKRERESEREGCGGGEDERERMSESDMKAEKSMYLESPSWAIFQYVFIISSSRACQCVDGK